MIADRRHTRGYYNSSTDRVFITIESLPCTKGTQKATKVFWDMMKQIVDDPQIFQTGSDSPFDRLTIEHNDKCWVIKTETLVTKDF